MDTFIKDVEQAVITARNEALAAGVAPENLESVVAIIALRNLNEEEQSNSFFTMPSESMDLEETLAEWASQFTLKTHVDRFVAIAWYLFDKQKITAVNTGDVMNNYQKARWDKPKNPADVFGKAAEKLFFTEYEGGEPSENGLKLWRLTTTGRKYLESLKKEL